MAQFVLDDEDDYAHITLANGSLVTVSGYGVVSKYPAERPAGSYVTVDLYEIEERRIDRRGENTV